MNYRLNLYVQHMAEALHSTAAEILAETSPQAIDLADESACTAAQAIDLADESACTAALQTLSQIWGRLDRLYLQLRRQLITAASNLGSDCTVEYRFCEPDTGSRIELEDEQVRITLPALLPFKSTSYACYLPRKLHALLERAAWDCRKTGASIPRFRDAALILVYGVPEAATFKRYRDYDNLERKSILDLLHSYFFYSDSMTGLITTEIAICAGQEQTEIILCLPNKLPEQLGKLLNHRNWAEANITR